MKLKKVTALLLATSMVLSSVSVGTFADDEIIFEPEVSVTTEAGEDEAYFGEEEGDVVVNEQTATDDEAFFDEVIVEENDDVVTDEVVDEQVSYAFDYVEEDLSSYINESAEETTYADLSGSMSKTYTYDGTPHPLDVANAQIPASTLIQFNSNTPENPIWVDESPTATHVDESKNIPYRLSTDNGTTWTPHNGNDGKSTITITAKPVSVSIPEKTYKVGDTIPTLTVADFDFGTLATGDTAASKFKVLNGTLSNTVLTLKKQSAGNWVDVVQGTDVSTGYTKFLKAGRYQITFANDKKVTDLLEEIPYQDGAVNDYSLSYTTSYLTVTDVAREITVTWPDDLTYNEDYQKYTPVAPAGITLTPPYDDTHKDAGTYTFTITKAVDGSGLEYTVTNPEHQWKINKAKAYAFVTADQKKDLKYGTKDPASYYTVDDIKFKKENNFDSKQEIGESVTGTAQFSTTYSQYDPVYTFSAAGKTNAVYAVKYAGGLQMANYEIVAGTDERPASETKGTFTLVPVTVKVAPNSMTVPYGEAAKEPTYKLVDGKDGDGSAATLQHDIDAGIVKVNVYTAAVDADVKNYTKATPVAIGAYPYRATIEDGTSGTYGSENYALAYDTKELTPSGTKALEISNDNKYRVTTGNLDMTFSDYEGVYDGKAHGIVITPDPVPTGVTVYYDTDSIKTDKDGMPTSGSTTPLTYADPGKYTVYYYVVSDNLGKGLSGSNKVVIKSVDEDAADKVEKQIEEAVKPDAAGNLDADKIAEARKAYDALTDAQKKLVDPYDVKALKDAEEKVKEQTDEKAAKAVEDLIDKLPAADKATADDAEAADAAKEAYDALTDAQKALVPADKVKKMNDVKAAADEAAKMDDAKKAKAVEDAIAALPEADQATAADKAAADAAKEAYDALTDAQKALVPADAVDKMNAVKAAADAAAEEDEKAEKERELFDEAVALVKAQKNGVDGKNAADNAKKAYENLSDAAKAKLTDEEIDAYEDTQKAYAKNFTFNSGEGVFKVLGNGEVTYFKPLHPENTWFVVPNMVKKNGFMYKVIKVSTKAFMGCVNATKIKIGKNVQVMGEYVFKNTPAMGKLIFLTSKLASGKVQNSFVAGGKNGGAKLTNYVPSGKSSAYDSLFKGEGGMNAKAKFTENN